MLRRGIENEMLKLSLGSVNIVDLVIGGCWLLAGWWVWVRVRVRVLVRVRALCIWMGAGTVDMGVC
jgi:hypothetical protein